MAITKLSVSTVKNGLLKSNKIWDQTSTWVDAPTNSYFPIASYTVPATAQASITFAGIPQNFTHLQIRGLIKSSGGSGPYIAYGRFNDDTASNYSDHTLSGNGTTTAATGDASISKITVAVIPDSSYSNVFTSFALDIFDYTNTNKYKTTRSLSGYETNSNGRVYFSSGSWRSTSAISSITFSLGTSQDFPQYSNISIYGVN